MALRAWDNFTTDGDVGGRLAEDGVHVWTERPTLPIVGAAVTPVFEAPATSSLYTTQARVYSNQGTGKAPLATVDVGVHDVDLVVDVETIGVQGEGAMLVGRWTSNSLVAMTLYRAISSDSWSVFARRYTTSPFAVTSLANVSLGSVGSWGGWYAKLRMVVVGTLWTFYVMEGSTTNTPPPAGRPWVEVGSAVDTSGVTSTHHGVGIYFGGPFVGGAVPGFGVDNFRASDPDTGEWAIGGIAVGGGGWTVGLVS